MAYRKKISINQGQIAEALSEGQSARSSKALRIALGTTPTELAADIVDQGALS